MGNNKSPYKTSLTPEQREQLQAEHDRHKKAFEEFIARFRAVGITEIDELEITQCTDGSGNWRLEYVGVWDTTAEYLLALLENLNERGLLPAGKLTLDKPESVC